MNRKDLFTFWRLEDFWSTKYLKEYHPKGLEYYLIWFFWPVSSGRPSCWHSSNISHGRRSWWWCWWWGCWWDWCWGWCWRPGWRGHTEQLTLQLSTVWNAISEGQWEVVEPPVSHPLTLTVMIIISYVYSIFYIAPQHLLWSKLAKLKDLIHESQDMPTPIPHSILWPHDLGTRLSFDFAVSWRV